MTESKTPASAPEQATPIALTPGVMLREAREASGQTHAAVGEALHLTVHYIKALENDDYSKLPGLIFVKGYIRAYGQYLKMDVDALIRSYDALVVSTVTSASQPGQPNPYDRRQHGRRRNDQSHGWALLAGFIVIVALGAGWWFVGRDTDGEVTAADVSADAPASATVSTQAAADAPLNRPFSSANGNAAATQVAVTPTSTMTTTAAATAATTAATTSSEAGTYAAPAATSMAASLTTALNSTFGTSSGVTEAALTAPATLESPLENALPTADVTSAATAIAPTGAVIQSAENAPGLLQTTVTEDGLTIIPAADGSRQVSMFSAGNDELLLRFAGDSWVEIDDGTNVRLYSDMLNAGDTLTIQGTAPFQLLLGNARDVEVNFNDSAVNIASSIREDNTARVQLSNPGTEAPLTGTGVAQ